MTLEEFKYQIYVLRRPVTLLIVLLACFGIIYFVSIISEQRPHVREEKDTSIAGAIREGTLPLPEFTEKTKKQLQALPQFSALASYTDRGFEPMRLVVKKGETVRFTNNSSEQLWIAAKGGEITIYPKTGEVCGSSDLDSCEPFAPQDFWQFTFTIAGRWEVVNNLDKSKSGVIEVQE